MLSRADSCALLRTGTGDSKTNGYRHNKRYVLLSQQERQMI